MLRCNNKGEISKHYCFDALPSLAHTSGLVCPEHVQNAMYDLRDPLLQSNKKFAKQICEMGELGQSAYLVDGMTVHDIPAQAISGSVRPHGKTFSGEIDLVNGEIKINCAEELSFWLRVDLNQVPHFAARPGGPLHAQAHESFTSHSGGESGDPKGVLPLDDKEKGECKRKREEEAAKYDAEDDAQSSTKV